MLVDNDDKPVGGAKVWVEMLATYWDQKLAGSDNRWSGRSYQYYSRDILGGSPLESLFGTTTDENGAFAFTTFKPDSWLRLAVTARDGSQMRVKLRTNTNGAIGTRMEGTGFVAALGGKESKLVVYPAAGSRDAFSRSCRA